MSTGSSTSSSSSTGAAARSGSSTRRIRSARPAPGARSRCSSFAATGHRAGSTRNRWALPKPSFSGAGSCAPSLPALRWSHPDADERSPLLVAHDGPEYADHSSLLTLLGRLPPLRAVLLAPIDRNETYSASALYARALVEELLPAFGPARHRIGVGASLGALSLLHAHRRYPASFDALFLQSGSFFRRRDRHESRFPRFDRISRFTGSVLAGQAERPIPVTIACGTIEDNFPANAAMFEALRRQGYDARFQPFRDGHNWVAWRDSFHPHLEQLIERAT